MMAGGLSMHTLDDTSPESRLETVDAYVALREHIRRQLQLHFALQPAETLPGRLKRLAERFERVLAERGEPLAQEFRDSVMKALPALRIFGFSLTGDASGADDLVQETLVKAWANQQRFRPGSNMIAWLFTIMRNRFYMQ